MRSEASEKSWAMNIKATRTEIGCVHKEIKVAGEILVEKIDGAREKVTGEMRDLSDTLK